MPHIAKVSSNEVLPHAVDVAIIGAGIAGISAALEMVERGLRVGVFEKGEVAAEQSSRNWGWCRQMGRDPREIPLIKLSLELWRGMNNRIGEETGFRTQGIAYMAKTEKALRVDEAWMRDHARPNAIDSRIVRGAGLNALVPGAARDFVGALYTPSDGKAEPFIAVPAMAKAVQAKGGLIFTQCAVRGVELSAGKISAVVTERGVVKCSSVLVAGGYWSRHFLANMGVSFPQLGVRASVQRIAPLDNGQVTTFSGGKFAVRKRLDGGFTVTPNFLSFPEIVPASFIHGFGFLPLFKLNWRDLRPRLGSQFKMEWDLPKRWKLDALSPFERVRVLDPKPMDWVLDDAVKDLQSTLPAFADAQVIERWAGIIDATPDAVPVISAIDKVPGLFLSSGYSGHGFGIGPAAGKLAADLVLGDTPCVDPSPFAFSRFKEGKGARPTTGV